MASPLAGTQEATEYATLPMDRYITGLWTQRSLLRDADVPYLYGKFYSASRYDSLCDGLNRELSADLTLDRAAGTSQYWPGFPDASVNSYYSYKWIQDGVEQLNVMADAPSNIWNATPSIRSLLFAKGNTNKTRFVGVNTELFFTDGINKKKWLRAAKSWGAAKTFTVGDFIIDTNGNIQSFQGQATDLTITDLEVVQITLPTNLVVPQNFLKITLAADAPKIPSNIVTNFSGITGAGFTSLNGTGISYDNIQPGWNLGLSSQQIAFRTTLPVTASTPSAGTASTTLVFDAQGNNLKGTTDVTQPTWATTWGGVTQDGAVNTGVTWTCFQSPLQEWQIATPTDAPTFVPYAPTGGIGPSESGWQPNFPGGPTLFIDSNGSYQILVAGSGGSGAPSEPIWNTKLGGKTQSGADIFENVGQAQSWIPKFQYGQTITCIIDSNNNLQVTHDYFQTQTIWTAGIANTNGATSITGTVEPTWATAEGATTTDGSYIWSNVGPAMQLSAGTYKWSYSYHGIDGSVTTAAPVATQLNPIVGMPGMYSITLLINYSTDLQCDQIWIWRTAGGQSTLVFLDSVPNLIAGSGHVTYVDTIPDTTTVGEQALIPQIPAPVSESADPPPDGMTAPVFHMGRIWAIVDNTVINSGGPDTITGNGNTAFPPLNSFAFPEQPIKIRPITIQGGGTVVYTTTSTYLIPGFGTSQSPFGQPQIYMAGVGIMNYDAEEIVGSTSYLFTTKRKFCSLDPSAGYIECGYPIGDQFKRVTTGDINAALYNPSSTFVTWHEADSGDTAIYVADGAVGWFRYSPISTPETGYVWSPRRAIVGGTSAVQSVETSPGINSMLIGPAASGPILMRDTSLSADNGTPYPSWFTIGNITLCESGQVAEVAHIALKSPAIGARPSISVLFGELFATPEVPFEKLKITGNDPPDLPASKTMYSNRYSALQNGDAPLCDNFQFKIDYGTQDFPDRLLKHSIYGAHHEERRQQ